MLFLSCDLKNIDKIIPNKYCMIVVICEVSDS
jgi:hypothetical protein